MAVRDWLTSPVEWGEWGTRANFWFNELVRDVRANTAAAAAAKVNADAALLDLARYTSAYQINQVTNLNAGTTTTAVTDLAIAVPVVNGGVYKISFEGHAYSSVVADVIRFRIVGPGATPLYAHFDCPAHVANTQQPAQGRYVFTASSTTTLTFNLQHLRASGTGTVYAYAEPTVLRPFTLWSERIA